MAIRRQDLSVLLMYSLGYSRIRNWVLRLRHKPVVAFVYFHDLPPQTIRCFKASLLFLKRSTNVVSFDDYFSGRLSSEKLNVVITFDDGYKSWITEAVPILKELGLPATFFISSGFVGLPKEDELEFIRSKLLLKLPTGSISGCLSVEDVKKLVEEGFSVGGHTVNHCNLAELRDRAQLGYEIAEDKMKLEKIIGRKIDYFAYPFGACKNLNLNLLDALRESGYKAAVTTVSGFNTANTDPYLLHREITYASMPTWAFKARVYGNYHAVRFLKQQLGIILQRR